MSAFEAAANTAAAAAYLAPGVLKNQPGMLVQCFAVDRRFQLPEHLQPHVVASGLTDVAVLWLGFLSHLRL